MTSAPTATPNAASASFAPTLAGARVLDATDPLAPLRSEFLFPRAANGEPALYFCGNSLGLQPRGVRAALDEELEDWARLAVDAHFEGRHPWYSYHEQFRYSGARLVGARPGEVVLMNSLTVNLHLLLASFYRPTAKRYRILIDEPAFPSDRYVVTSQLAHHGFDPREGLLTVAPRPGAHTVAPEQLEELLASRGDEIALVLLGAVNFFSGQLFDLPRLARAAHAAGATFGLDLAHAAGNVELALHDWEVDFAAWCSYKYLNAGPGAVAGAFVHERHGANLALPRLAGWWGNDPVTRFQMHLQPEFVPRSGAEGWQLSNPPILALAPLRSSLALFDRVGMPALRQKSERLTGYLEFLLDRLPGGTLELITPRTPAARGCQLSLLVRKDPERLKAALTAGGAVCDFRPPNVLRVAPVPLYNRFEDVFRLFELLRQAS
ncbi:MAG: kynureninase [Deltaproteobacteria bacterium]|nr:kynureninase [Deltaproteobacteria bacterium]